MTPLVNLWSLKSWWGRRERVRQRMRLLKKGSVQKHAQRRRLPFSPPSTMIVLSWNCRGLGNPCAVTVLSHLVREKAPDVLFLKEIKRTVDEMKLIQAELHYDGMFAVPCILRAGGLAMLWKEQQVDLHVQTYTQNHINAHIRTNPSAPWRIIGFYGRLEEY